MNRTILAVDDNEAHSYVMERTLAKAGYAVVQAGTGAEALIAARRYHPGLILLDVNLPDSNGFDVCRYLKEQADTSDIPIVIHSASTPGGAGQMATTCGASAYLTFPIEPDHLLNVVRGCLARAADGVS